MQPHGTEREVEKGRDEWILSSLLTDDISLASVTLFWQMRFEGISAGERFFILWKETEGKMTSLCVI